MFKTHEGMIVEKRQLIIDQNAHCVYRNFTSLGGERGWLFMNWAWRVRGMIDRLFGGVGLRRGRRHPSEIRVGDALDFWRVEEIKHSEMMLLSAEMKMPGDAWLQFEVQPQGLHKSMLIQTAYFAPKGLVGILYWYLLYPIHALIFSGLIKQIAKTTSTVFVRENVSDCRIKNQRSMADL